MTDRESAAFSRVCPQCSRRVPNTLRTCRCGYVLGDGITPGSVESAGDVQQPGTRSHLASLAITLVVVIAAVLGTAYLMNQRTAASH